MSLWGTVHGNFLRDKSLYTPLWRYTAAYPREYKGIYPAKKLPCTVPQRDIFLIHIISHDMLKLYLKIYALENEILGTPLAGYAQMHSTECPLVIIIRPIIITSLPVWVRSIAMSESVCLFVCLSVCLYVYLYVCPLAYLKHHTTKLYEIFCTRQLWPWLGPPLTNTAICYVLPVLWMTSCLPIVG